MRNMLQRLVRRTRGLAPLEVVLLLGVAFTIVLGLRAFYTSNEKDIKSTINNIVKGGDATFRAPLHMLVVSRFLAPGGAPFEYPLRATATFTAEGPETEAGTIGIDYTPNALPKKEAAR